MRISQARTDILGIEPESVYISQLEDAQGSQNMNVDGSVTPVTFRPRGYNGTTKLLVNRMAIQIQSDGILTMGEFGNLPELSNGLRYDSTEQSEPDYLFKTNGDIISFASDAETVNVKFGSTESAIIIATLDFTNAFDNSMIVRDGLSMTVQDDLSSLDFFRVSVHGVIVDTS